LVKPTTYVNLSGVAALELKEVADFEIKDFLVVVDDINLPLGKIRIRSKGGDGGHNGLNSIIYSLESDQFPRLRIGIGNDFEDGFMADYVLSKFNNDEREIINEKINFSLQLIEVFIKEDYVAMLNFFSKLTKGII
jgi:PTH1 family peptidyl-tRNA hydrolase